VSQENVELVRRSMEAFDNRDLRTVADALTETSNGIAQFSSMSRSSTAAQPCWSIGADWERGDWSSAAWAHPDIEYVMVDEPGERTVTGLAAMADAWRGFLTSWRGYRVEPVEYRELDVQRVLVLVRAFGLGAASGVDLESMGPGRMGLNLFDVRDGKVTRLTAYTAVPTSVCGLYA
jgi:hypothetical protein